MAADFILVDTSVLSEARKIAGELNDDIVFFLRQIPAGALAVPQAAVFELQRGASMIARTRPSRGRAYSQWLDDLLATDAWLPPVDAPVRRLLAQMTTEPDLIQFWIDPRKEPTMRFGCDPEIAATAIVHGLPIASTDVTDFLKIHRHFPLPGLYCPIGGRWHVRPPEGWSLGESFEASDGDWRRVIGPIEYYDDDASPKPKL
ncbi:type II toxin-antitoxin system VapC family toxin [Rhizobium leguminosarum]|uniref:hypothetical protein n=1 Tax=Rhizobium leguminosarum TaxID=384 RepID=UPI001C980EE7|nr:hypothetical protein [Rhizobium leguminosarum]MBY5399508.1 type II toxin-antitoxin system VapC family toxin [Rhizobium leguminosarum]